MNYYVNKGQITKEYAAQQLKIYLNKVIYYENRGLSQIAVQQLVELNMLLDLQKRNSWMHHEAYHTLKTDVTDLIDKINP